MSVCSQHQTPESDCDACQTQVEDIPHWMEKLQEAKDAGLFDCLQCGFTFYKTVSACPKCGAQRPSEDAE